MEDIVIIPAHIIMSMTVLENVQGRLSELGRPSSEGRASPFLSTSREVPLMRLIMIIRGRLLEKKYSRQHGGHLFQSAREILGYF